jgi:hypothetical protein
MASGSWNTQTWGLGTWGQLGDVDAPVTGQALTTSLGNESIKIDVVSILTGQSLTANLASVTAVGFAETFPTGFPLTAAQGTVDASPDAMATGNQANMGLGTVDAFNTTGWGRLQWGINSWGRPGIDIVVSPTGIPMTAALGTGSEAKGSATIIANTLNIAQLTLGVVDPAPDAALTGNFMIASQLGMRGDVSPTITGFGLTANLGNETIDLNTPVDVTGIALTAALGNESITTDVDVSITGFELTTILNSANALIWNEINTGILNSANALIWNEINTGSAPIDPPGWREVVA